MSARYVYHIVGTTWGQFEGTHTYESQRFTQDIAAIAGDFATIKDYECIRITRGGSWSHEWTKRKVMRPWRSADSADVFAEAA